MSVTNHSQDLPNKSDSNRDEQDLKHSIREVINNIQSQNVEVEPKLRIESDDVVTTASIHHQEDRQVRELAASGSMTKSEQPKNIWRKIKTFVNKRKSSLRFVKTTDNNQQQQQQQIVSSITRNTNVKLVVNEASNRVELHQVSDVDCGYAWIILIVMFIINASTFGTARAYGLIFEKIARQDEQGRTLAALPFTIMGAVENMGGPLTGYLLARTTWRTTVFVGSCLITLSHLLASIDDSILNRTLTIGLMCGLGCSFVTISSFQINNSYFERYRSRAFGIGLTGAAVGTFYISPLCQYVLDNYTTSVCYLLLGIILFPNVLLSLLLKPKKLATELANESNAKGCSSITESQSAALEVVIVSCCCGRNSCQRKQTTTSNVDVESDSQKYAKQEEVNRIQLWKSIKFVLKTPLFHLIWPTQLLFCWLNFVFGMIIVDFGIDRNLSNEEGSNLILVWAFGQLAGRLVLGYLVDLKFFSYKTFTIICFIFISLATWILNNIRLADNQLNYFIISSMIFMLAVFISTIYILFNNLIVEYMESSLHALSVGISSFTGSFFLLPRANIIGYYRDTVGNYDSMLTMFTCISFGAAIVWLLIPFIIDKIKHIYLNSLEMRLTTALVVEESTNDTNHNINCSYNSNNS